MPRVIAAAELSRDRGVGAARDMTVERLPRTLRALSRSPGGEMAFDFLILIPAKAGDSMLEWPLPAEVGTEAHLQRYPTAALSEVIVRSSVSHLQEAAFRCSICCHCSTTNLVLRTSRRVINRVILCCIFFCYGRSRWITGPITADPAARRDTTNWRWTVCRLLWEAFGAARRVAWVLRAAHAGFLELAWRLDDAPRDVVRLGRCGALASASTPPRTGTARCSGARRHRVSFGILDKHSLISAPFRRSTALYTVDR